MSLYGIVLSLKVTNSNVDDAFCHSKVSHIGKFHKVSTMFPTDKSLLVYGYMLECNYIYINYLVKFIIKL